MRLLGKLYLSEDGDIYIHSAKDGVFYLVNEDGIWIPSFIRRVRRSWRLIGDSYAKD